MANISRLVADLEAFADGLDNYQAALNDLNKRILRMITVNVGFRQKKLARDPFIVP